MAGRSDALTLPTGACWRGPEGHALLSYEVDLSEGRGSRLRLRSPEGTEYWLEDAHLEIVEPERIVFIRTLSNGRMTFRRSEG